MNAALFFAHVERPRRGYYKLVLQPLAERPADYPDFQITELYMQQLEALIRQTPHLWLWTHKRWKYQRG